MDKTVAKQCSAIMEKIWIYYSKNNIKQLKRFYPLHLWWVNTKESYINIYPGQDVQCNIGHVFLNQAEQEKLIDNLIDVPDVSGNGLRFIFITHGTVSQQPNCLKPGRYVIKIIVYSENANPQPVYFDINWNGNVSGIEVCNELNQKDRNNSGGVVFNCVCF